MTIDAQVVAFTVMAALLTITPGPDTLLVLKNALSRGRTAGLLTTLGICSGLFFHGTLSALGVSALLVHSATAFELLKVLGAGVLVVLGVQSLRSAFVSSVGAETTTPMPHWSGRRSFTEGLLTNVLNPKVAIFYLAVLAQFVTPGDSVLARSLLLTGIHATQGVIWLSLVALVTGQARGLVMRRRGVQRTLQGVAGVALIGLGARLAFAKR